MRRMLFALSLAALSLVGWPATQAVAQDAKTATGTVIAVGGTSVTVKVGAQEMKFSVDDKTVVEAAGAGTKDRQASAAGKPGPKLVELVKVGQAVAVTFTDMAGNLQASRIRAVPALGAGGGSVSSSAPAEMTSNGTVTSMGASSITITGSTSGGGSFTQTFTIDAETRVVGVGAGTATAAKGGKAPFKELVGNGDRVNVSYHKKGDTLHASEVRVTAKGTP